jgi:two-component sensor histidine kinase
VRAYEFAFAVDNGVWLHRVLASTLEPYTSHSSALVIEPGPDARLAAKQAQPLSLILHELATNAVKYGALSIPEGRVGIRWNIEKEEARLCWRESGGPPTSVPVEIGFGTRLIQVAAAELGAHLELHYEPTGLIAEIIIPLSASSEG